MEITLEGIVALITLFIGGSGIGGLLTWRWLKKKAKAEAEKKAKEAEEAKRKEEEAKREQEAQEKAEAMKRESARRLRIMTEINDQTY